MQNITTSQRKKETIYMIRLVVMVLDTILHNLTLKLFRLFSKVQYFILNWLSLFIRCYLQYVQDSNINWRSYTERLNEHRCNKNSINNNKNNNSIITQQRRGGVTRMKSVVNRNIDSLHELKTVLSSDPQMKVKVMRMMLWSDTFILQIIISSLAI